MGTRKMYASNSTHNRGIEAKEEEIGNIQLDVNVINSVGMSHSDLMRGSVEHAVDGSPHNFSENTQVDSIPTSNGTDSYLQVVVQKHRTKSQGVNTTNVIVAPPPTPRLPYASSPIKPQPTAYGDISANPGMYVFPHAMLYYPSAPNPWNSAKFPGHTFVESATSARSSTSFKKLVQAVRCDKKRLNIPKNTANITTITEEPIVESKWTCFGKNDSGAHDGIPERIEVYYFERGCPDYLSTTDCSPVPYTERLVARGGRVVERIFAEIFGVLQLFVTVPVDIVIQCQRLALVSLRSIVVGTTQTSSDYLLKPLLTVLFNALIQPPLIFVTNVGSALRNTLQPVWGVLEDMTAPLGRLVSSFRLVQIDKRCKKCCDQEV